MRGPGDETDGGRFESDVDRLFEFDEPEEEEEEED
jgi:hypothetical protein